MTIAYFLNSKIFYTHLYIDIRIPYKNECRDICTITQTTAAYLKLFCCKDLTVVLGSLNQLPVIQYRLASIVITHFFFFFIISIVTIDGSHICFVGRLRFFLIVKGDITLSRPRLNIVSEFS